MICSNLKKICDEQEANERFEVQDLWARFAAMSVSADVRHPYKECKFVLLAYKYV